jgi:prophage antirepressor-like protein
MSTNIIPFTYKGQNVRTMMRDGELWWVASDVCKILEIANVGNAISRLDGDGIRRADVTDSLGRLQEMAIVNEPNLYRLIFRSDKLEAKRFQNWVYKEVLPSIRKTGTYSVQPLQGGIGEIVSDPKLLTKYIYHLQGLQEVLYPEHIEQPLPPDEQMKQDVLRILKNVGKPLTPSMLRYSYFKSTPKEALQRTCEELHLSGKLTKEVTRHAPEGRYIAA